MICNKCGYMSDSFDHCSLCDHREEDTFGGPRPRSKQYVNASYDLVDKPKPTVLGTQVGGSHYTDCAIQPIEYIWANNLGFSEGNIIKYVTRWKAKGGIKDLEKAKHHIALLIEHAEQAPENRRGLSSYTFEKASEGVI